MTSLSCIIISIDNENLVFLKLETNHIRMTLTIKIQFSFVGLTSLMELVFCLNSDIVSVSFQIKGEGKMQKLNYETNNIPRYIYIYIYIYIYYFF